MPDPPLRGVVVVRARKHADLADILAKEALSALRALKTEPAASAEAQGEPDLVVLVVEPDAPLPEKLPDLKDRAATAIAVSDVAAEGRVAVTSARKRLRAAGAALGARELVVSTSNFGILGLESDAVRERLHILLQALVVDADRLRLRREGWEEP